MNALFRGGPVLEVRTRDGLNVGLITPKEVVVEDDDGSMTFYQMPASAGEDDSDGASIPPPGQLFGLDHYGSYWPGAVVHDFIFRRRLLQLLNNNWVKLTYVDSGANPKLGQMDFARANLIFKALMFSLGTDNTKATVIYDALVECGRKAWNEDASLSLTA